ncbi:MAG TPA: hypothetical protein VFP65_18395 [Anaeromyxobacteraceae bacterium]|nr:hypothetical protein [Anaeromyxobacteraceae bacterium]
MKNLGTSIAALARRAPRTMVLAILLLSAHVAAAEDHSGWSMNFTPVLILPSGNYGLGGGVDPELKYTVDLGEARLSAGGRVGTYYAKNLFSVTVMPTLRLTVPIGRVEPYAAIGLGHGWLPDIGHDGLATMGRLGFVYRFSSRLAIGLEGTVQQIDGSRYRFPSFGSMMSFNL